MSTKNSIQSIHGIDCLLFYSWHTWLWIFSTWHTASR